MFRKKNRIVPQIKVKKMLRAKAEDDLNKFFKTKIRVETDTKIYITDFYIPREEKKCCNIL